jgi:hypothetical protein
MDGLSPALPPLPLLPLQPNYLLNTLNQSPVTASTCHRIPALASTPSRPAKKLCPSSTPLHPKTPEAACSTGGVVHDDDDDYSEDDACHAAVDANVSFASGDLPVHSRRHRTLTAASSGQAVINAPRALPHLGECFRDDGAAAAHCFRSPSGTFELQRGLGRVSVSPVCCQWLRTRV